MPLYNDMLSEYVCFDSETIETMTRVGQLEIPRVSVDWII